MKAKVKEKVFLLSLMLLIAFFMQFCGKDQTKKTSSSTVSFFGIPDDWDGRSDRSDTDWKVKSTP